MKILVCGGRDYDKWDVVRDTLDRYRNYPGLQIIHGAAKGADFLGQVWAVYRRVSHRPFPANWSLYGKAAGHRRNAEMLAIGKPDIIIAFPGGEGTADMVRRGKAAGVPVVEIPDLI